MGYSPQKLCEIGTKLTSMIDLFGHTTARRNQAEVWNPQHRHFEHRFTRQLYAEQENASPPDGEREARTATEMVERSMPQRSFV